MYKSRKCGACVQKKMYFCSLNFKLQKMKKIIVLLFVLALSLPTTIFAQIYQLPNGGFELWDGTASDVEPTNWNSFATSECTLPLGCSSAQQPHHENSSDVRPGSAGSHSCRIYSTSIMGVVANGNMTTGRIHAGSITASSSSNYNVSYPTQSGFAQAFNGKPDYMKFWAKVHTASSSTEARMNTVVHSNYAVRDPVVSSEYQYIAGVATLNFSGNNTWQEYTIPFSYAYGNAAAQYILITFATNKTPGGGSDGDELFIDDIEFVYISTLSDLKSNGVTVPNFNADTHDYSIELPYGSSLPTVTATAVSVNGIVTITQPTQANPIATIVVAQGPSTTTYTINYTFAARESADLLDILLDESSINNYNVTPAFSSNVMNYSVLLPYGSQLPVVDGVLDVPEAQMTITQATDQNPVAVLSVTCGSLAKTYTVNFTVAPENSSDLADLQVDGVTVPGFSADQTDYFVQLALGAEVPVVSATALSPFAVLQITQATADNMTATVVVTCDTLLKTYNVHFLEADPYSTLLASIMVNNALLPNFNSTTYDYNYELPFGTSLATLHISAEPVSPLASLSPIVVDTLTQIAVYNGGDTTVYTINFVFAAEQTADLADLRVDDVTVLGFDAAITNYSVVAFGTAMPEVTATPRSADGVVTITQATEENPVATVLVTCNGLSKTYTVNITLVEANADLADLQLDGITIDGFSADVTEYTYEILPNHSLPAISAVAVSQYATLDITQPTMEDLTAAIVVTCGPLVKTYTINVVVGVKEFDLQDVVVYPNPVTDELHIAIGQGRGEIAIYSMTGQLMLSQMTENDDNVMNVNVLPAGVYVVEVRNGGAVLGRAKFVKR